MIYIYLALVLTLPEAIYEGLRKNHPTASFVVEFMFRFAIAVIVFAVAGGMSFPGTQDNYLYHIFGYVLFRFAIFDFVYNFSAGLPLTFIGSTKLYDRVLAKVPTHLIVFGKGIALFIGIVWLLK
jgi:hypothetical protein